MLGFDLQVDGLRPSTPGHAHSLTFNSLYPSFHIACRLRSSKASVVDFLFADQQGSTLLSVEVLSEFFLFNDLNHTFARAVWTTIIAFFFYSLRRLALAEMLLDRAFYSHLCVVDQCFLLATFLLPLGLGTPHGHRDWLRLVFVGGVSRFLPVWDRRFLALLPFTYRLLRE